MPKSEIKTEKDANSKDVKTLGDEVKAEEDAKSKDGIMLKLEGLHLYYGESHVVHGIDLDLPAGNTAVILGRNGVGKTTLCRGIMGVLHNKHGKVSFEGEDISRLAPFKRARLGFGYCPQGRDIFSNLTVLENLEAGLEARRDGVLKVPEVVYELFPILKDFRQRKGGDLSGGQQQMLALGRAMVLDPKLLILDEPTEGIQPSIIMEIEDVVRRIKEEFGVALILVEQYLEFAWDIGDEFCIIAKGQVIERGNPKDVDMETIKEHLTV